MTIHKMFFPASDSYSDRSEASNIHQAKHYLPRVQNRHTWQHLCAYSCWERKISEAFTFSCSASSFESLKIRPFSLCFTSSCKLWTKAAEENVRQKGASGTYPFKKLHSDIQRDHAGLSLTLWSWISRSEFRAWQNGIKKAVLNV